MSCDFNVIYLFVVQKKIKKRKEHKINIKSEKLNKRKEKLSVSKAFHNRRVAKEGDSEDWIRKDRYAKRNNNRNVIR